MSEENLNQLLAVSEDLTCDDSVAFVIGYLYPVTMANLAVVSVYWPTIVNSRMLEMYSIFGRHCLQLADDSPAANIKIIIYSLSYVLCLINCVDHWLDRIWHTTSATIYIVTIRVLSLGIFT